MLFVIAAILKISKKNVKLPNKAYYCANCIQLGRLTSKDFLYHVDEPNAFDVPNKILTWKGCLNAYQKSCSTELMQKVAQKQDHLVWAVTGAGKTEILFEMLAANLKLKKRIAIATPRIDVCNELYPRLQSAFKQIKIALLHGESSQKYFYSQLTICTTHQLLNFYHAFDILIIDEIDSFPFVKNETLQLAAKRACKKDASKIYLSATPDGKTLRKVQTHQLSASYLPLRFHKHLLAEVQFILEENLYENLAQEKLPQKLVKLIQKWIEEQRRVLIFVPQIKYLQPVLKTMRKILSAKIKGESVHANDPQRSVKIQQFRSFDLHYLVTTTILERGVTFSNLNLTVIGAEDHNFSCSSLVQIAGRVGRDKKYPKGEVYFVVHHYNWNVKEAAAQIKRLNQKARDLLNE